MNKAELRKEFAAMRLAIAPAEHSRLSDLIATRIFSSLDLSTVKVLHCFVSMKHRGEVETLPIFEGCWSRHPNIVTTAPRTDPSSSEMESYVLTSESELVANSFLVPEPTGNDIVRAAEIDVIFVPLLCFDERLYRVGYGKGFYDRYLNRCRPDCLKIGLSFFPPIRMIEGIHEYDVALDVVFTPEATFER